MVKKQKPLRRGAGILLPVSSLPSEGGIGTFGAQARVFVDFLAAAGQTYWQVLPLGPTGYGDSPYQSFSAFAGNPYFIDLDSLVEQGLLTAKEIASFFWGDDPARVNYTAVYEGRFPLLRQAHKRFVPTEEYARFCAENEWWLDGYALYMALKLHFHNKNLFEWPEKLRLRDEKVLEYYRTILREETDFWKCLQFWFWQQWTQLRAYARAKGVQFIGDLPIYVSADSADLWENPDLFQLDEDGFPRVVAGVPPDCFSETGQLWGNPIYDWDAMEQEGFSWWKRRMQHTAAMYDLVRLDHFLGFVQYYAIPYGNETAVEGTWRQGPGEKLLDALQSVCGGCRIIAEDLGVPVPAVQKLLKKRGYPNMKVLQFAFDSGATNTFLPFHYDKNCVVYGGTHDNDTQVHFFETANRKTIGFAKKYLNLRRAKDIPAAIIRAGYASTANTCVYQMQDLLGLGGDARMNLPSTLGNNWQWRLLPEQLTPELAATLFDLAQTYGRLGTFGG